MIGFVRLKDENGNWTTSRCVIGIVGPRGPEGPVGLPGEMDSSVYDPQGKGVDIFAYIDSVFAAL